MLRLRLYFNTLAQVTSSGNDEPFCQHVAALDLLLAGQLRVDYNLLCCGSEACVEYVSRASSEVLDQVVAALPPTLIARLTPARLHLMLAEKVFFQHGADTDNWIEAFR